MPDVPNDVPAAPAHLTIDELAARTGVPSRTIRFYQTQGALPPPVRQGRIAIYNDEHIARLELIEVLQRRGLRLSAIADLVRGGRRESLSVGDWLGLDAHLAAPWTDDGPEQWDDAELDRRLAGRPPEARGWLERGQLIASAGPGHWDVPSPALFALTPNLDDNGVDLATAVVAGDILRNRLSAAADELVRHFADHAGRGFGRTLSPDELDRALSALRPLGVEAVRLIFGLEMERALRRSQELAPAPS